ncbi:TolC family outer membrane protein [Lentibacter algarum]|uniref:TolC family outer membrane protein n=1 Tax=Lentibacter algarum TaxID=576131 RepID=UPI001C077BAA|nr:TolC family outer membrane protein [Lentibacter algarum]MBU2981977.1 TolC family outer membrane protein [Lentibacter algarum]
MLRQGKATQLFKRSALACAAVALAASLGVRAQAETLADAMVGAYKHSGLIEKNRALLRAADEDVAIAISALRPIIGWSTSLTYNYARTGSILAPKSEGLESSVGLSAELLLLDGGASRMTIDVAKESVLATREALVAAEQQVLLGAVRAFLEVRRAAEFNQLRNNNVRVINEELKAARDRFEVGEVTRTDVSLAEARLAAARAQQAASQGDLARAIELYRAAVGRKPGHLNTPTAVANPAKSLEDAKSLALRIHPDMKRVQRLVTVSELQIMVAEARMKPSVKLSGSYGLTEQHNSTSYQRGGSVGITASGPIYQGGRLSALTRQAMAQRDSVRGDLHITRHSIAQEVGNAWADLRVSRASAEASERQVRASTVAFRGVREEATLGSRTTLDVLDAEQELLDARANLLSARIDEIGAGYTLLATMGLLTAERLKLNVPSYDPAAYYNMVKDAPVKRSKQGQQLDRVLRKLGKE